ncbi:DNA repair protein Nse1 [Pyronema omphalodes]|nr:DNA repair protein Nse1 [Pyronema omphalodes]
MEEYNDTHRALVQAFLARSTMTGEELVEVVTAIHEVENPEEPTETTPEVCKDMISRINTALAPFDFEIRSTRDQTTRTEIFAFVNINPDTIIQGATHHSADEIAFFRRLLDAMFETNNQYKAEVMAVSSNEALNLNKNPRVQPTQINGEDGDQTQSTGEGQGPGLTMKQAQEALEMFVDEGWLRKSRAGWYTLAPRGLLELSYYLQQTYNDEADPEESEDPDTPPIKRIKDCFACREIITIGQRCDKLDCPIRLHDPCAASFFKVNKNGKCPGCKIPWTGKEPVGEKAAAKLKRRAGGGADRRRSTQSSRRQRRRGGDGGP